MSLFSSKKQDEIDKLVNENDELKNQLHSVLLKQGSFEELENNLIRAKKELAELQLKDDTLLKNISDREASIADKEKYLGDLNSKILELEEIKDNLHSTINAYSAQVSLLEDRGKLLDEKAAQSAEIEIKLAQLVEKKEILDRDVADKEQTFAYLSTIEREIQADLEKERAQLDSIKNQVISLQTEIETSNIQYEESKNRIASLAGEEEAVSKKLNILNEEESRKTAHIKSLEDKILLNEEIKGNLETTLADLVAQLNRNENSYLEQSEKRDIIQNEILSLRKERDDLDNKLNLAKEQFEVFQQEASKHTALLNTLGEEVRKLEGFKEKLEREIETLKSDADKSLNDAEEKKIFLAEIETSIKEIEKLHIMTDKGFGALIEKYMADFDDSRKMKEDLEKETILKKSEAEELDKLIMDKRALLNETGALIAAEQKELNMIQTAVVSGREERDSVNSELASAKDNISRLSGQLAALRYETENLQIKKSDLQRDLSFLMMQISREYSEAELKLRNLNESVSAANNNLIELNSRIAKAGEELKNNISSAGESASADSESDYESDIPGNAAPDEENIPGDPFGTPNFGGFSLPDDISDD